MGKGILLSLLLLFAPVQAWATTYYISPTTGSPAGDDARSCVTSSTISTPKATFASGLACLAAGDTLYARTGTYIETVNLASVANGTNWTSGAITISSYQDETVWVRPSGGVSSLVVNNKSYFIWNNIGIDGVNETHCGTGCYDASISIIYSDHIRIQNSEIKNAYWSGIVVHFGEASANYIELISNTIHDGGRGYTSTDPPHGIYYSADATTTGLHLHGLIAGNTIYNIDHNSYGYHGYTGAVTNAANGIIVRNNVIHNVTYGMLLQSADDVPYLVYNNLLYNLTSSGIDVYSRLTGAKIYNNTIHACGYRGIEVGSSGAAVGILIKNNSITNCAAEAIRVGNASGLSSATIQYNDYNGNGNGNIPIDDNSLSTITNNITTVPAYTNAGAFDFSLAGGSGHIDAGTTLADVPYDIAGLARPQGTLYDIGAYERAQAQSPMLSRCITGGSYVESGTWYHCTGTSTSTVVASSGSSALSACVEGGTYFSGGVFYGCTGAGTSTTIATVGSDVSHTGCVSGGSYVSGGVPYYCNGADVAVKSGTVTVFVSDTFTGSSGTNLTSHTGETGATWAKQTGATGDMIISDANRARCSPVSTRCAYYASGTPTDANYTVQATTYRFTSVSYLGVAGRMATGNTTRYVCTYEYPGGYWELQAWNAGGTKTALGTYTQSLSNNTGYVITLTMNGTAIDCAIDGVSRIAVTDSSITAAGYAGVDAYDQTTNSTGYHLDTLTATGINW